MNTDTIGGFPFSEANCLECGEPLLLQNAWMTDGCPCNSPIGCNSLNETRWRLLMQLFRDERQRFDDSLVRLVAENVKLNDRNSYLEGQINLLSEIANERTLNDGS